MKKPSTCLCWESGQRLFTWVSLALLLALSVRATAQQTTLPCNATVSTAFDNVPNSFTGLTQSNTSPGLASWTNPGNVVDGSTATFATGNIVGGGSVRIGVKDPNHTYNAGNFAGFRLQPSAIAAAASLTITTRLAGAERDSRIIPVFLLSVSTPFDAGLITTQTFDEIELTYALVGIGGSINVFNAVQRGYCTATSTLACNTPTTPNGNAYPMIIDPANTGFTGLNVATVTNQDNAISPSTTDFAAVDVLLAAGSASFAIKDQLKDYPAGSFAGMDISSPGLATISALGGLTLSTYLNGVATGQSVSGAGLVSVGSGLLGGSGRRTIGFLATAAFDEVKLTISGATALGTTNIYGAVFETFCAGPSVACADNTIPQNTLTPLVAPTSPVYIDGNNTGFPGAVCAACVLNNAGNVIDADPTNFATVVLTAGVSTSATFAVANAVDTYPANSFAGFDIQTNSLVTANVVGSAIISLYNNGTLVQTGSGNAIVVGATTDLVNGLNRQVVGIVASVPYDEVKITFPSLVGLSLGTINIYSAIFEKTCAATIVCNTAYNLSNPTFPVVIDAARTGVVGLVSAATTIQNPWNVVSADATDFATITNTATVAANASIAVLDPISTYPVGTFAGFAVRKKSGLVLADLLGALTVSTYNNGVLQESRTGSGSLLDLSITLFGSTSDVANVGFVTTQSFDEIRLTVAPLVGVGVLNGNLDVFGTFIDTRTSAGDGLVCALNTNPDFAVTNKNVPATGSVKTNDLVPAGTTYGPAPTSTTQPAGSSPSLTVNSDGTYTFTSATPGVYVYAVPVCGSGLSGTACATQTLTVTVLDPTVNTNKPVANPDIVSTTGTTSTTSTASSVTINVKANDGPGNAGGTLGIPTIVTSPANGSATVDGSGNVVYTPKANFFGTDVLTYQVCETPGTNLCATATVTITVKAPDSPNTTVAADDYVSTYQSLSATGNVKTNDSDPEGNTQTITAQTTTIAGKGTLVVTSAGSYTFTPVAGATGPVDFSYTTTDTGSPAVSATGTLHVLINPFNPNPDFVVTNKTIPVTGSVKTNDVVPVGATYGPAPSSPASSPSGSTPSLTVNSDGTFTFNSATPGVYVYNVPVCAPAPATYCTTQTLTITVLDPAVTTNPPVANPDFATITGSPTATTATIINVKANDGPGNPGGSLGTPTIATGPAHGTASINGSGNLVYTPTAGYYGTDIVTYQVCETQANCATATVSITVKAPGAPANVSINDDYVSTAGITPATGNVLTNDQGNTLTVSNPGTTSTSSGTLVLTATGSYTFTPAQGVTGPVNLTYTACDNSTPSVCGSATLHVLVGQAMPDLTPIIKLTQSSFSASGNSISRNFTVELDEVKGQPTSSGNVAITVTVPFGYTFTFDNTLTNINVLDASNNNQSVTVDNTNWSITSAASNGRQIKLTMKSGQFIGPYARPNLGFTITRVQAGNGSSANITANVNDDATKTYDSNPLNNIYARIIISN